MSVRVVLGGVVVVAVVGTMILTYDPYPTVKTQVASDPKACLELLNKERPQTPDDNKRKCDDDYVAALAEHRANAPAFTTKAECQAEFPANPCEPTSTTHHSGSSHFSPMMTGYMLGSLMNRNGTPTSFPAQAAYYNGNGGGWFNAGGRKLSSRTGDVAFNGSDETLRKSPERTTTVSRGGFVKKAPVSTSKSPFRRSKSRIRIR